MWNKILSSVAPMLGTAIGGPFGGMATDFLLDAFSDDEEVNTKEELEAKIAKASPQTLIKLRELNNEFATNMKRLGIKEKDLAAKDRADARAMGINTTLVPQMIISTIFILAFAVILYTTFTGLSDMSPTQSTIVNILLGILSAGVVQVMNFWFGSSSGSKEKDIPQI